MIREIKLDGGEISVLKTIGFAGSQMSGRRLLDRVGDMEESAIVDTINGLLALGYVLSNKVNVRKREDVEMAFFRINPAQAKDLRAATKPSQARQESRTRRPRRG